MTTLCFLLRPGCFLSLESSREILLLFTSGFGEVSVLAAALPLVSLGTGFMSIFSASSDVNSTMAVGAGKVKDRTLIVNSPDCIVQDQSVNITWENLVGGLCSTFNERKPSMDVS